MSKHSQTTVTALLAQVRRGDASALGRLFTLVYDQLRELARIQRRRLSRPETLNTTALVHEAFIRLVGRERIELHDRAHFMAVAAIAMRQILISHARRQTASKRWGGRRAVSFEDLERALGSEPGFGEAKADALIVLDGALSRLSQYSNRQMRVVDCRFFGGMSIQETAVALGVSPATVKRDWSMAQAWLYREMHEALQ
jgi:RNA polymerase sigma factor (TIGR02999 family)